MIIQLEKKDFDNTENFFNDLAFIQVKDKSDNTFYIDKELICIWYAKFNKSNDPIIHGDVASDPLNSIDLDEIISNQYGSGNPVVLLDNPISERNRIVATRSAKYNHNYAKWSMPLDAVIKYDLLDYLLIFLDVPFDQNDKIREYARFTPHFNKSWYTNNTYDLKPIQNYISKKNYSHLI